MSLVFHSLSDSHRGCDSALTHPTLRPISPSIKRRRQQWVRRPQAARTIGGSDRWSHQRRCQDDTQTSPLSFPLSTLFASYQSSLPTSPQTPVWRGGGKDASLKRPIFHSQEVHLLVGLSGKMLHVVRLNYCARQRGEDWESEVTKVRSGKTDQCDKSAEIR